MTKILVVVAPGAYFKIPHPSGLSSMPDMDLGGGETLRVEAEEVQALFEGGRILHPTTKEWKQQTLPAIAPNRVTISVAGGPPLPTDGMDWAMALASAERLALEQIRAEQNAVIDQQNASVRPHYCTGPAGGATPPPPRQTRGMAESWYGPTPGFDKE